MYYSKSKFTIQYKNYKQLSILMSNTELPVRVELFRKLSYTTVSFNLNPTVKEIKRD